MTLDRIRLLMGGDYDRIRLLGGPYVRENFGLDVQVEEYPLPHDVFHELTHSDRGDGGELSLSFHSTMVSQPGGSPLVALPVFVSRFFRHGNILVNSNAEISAPSDLKGKVVGVPEYGSTMAVWARGMLADEHGIAAQDIHWRASRAPVALDDTQLRYPPGVDLRRATDRDIVAALSRGELDAVIGVVPNDLPPNVQRLYPDYAAVERHYYRRTGIFPIMHLLTLRRATIERIPDLPERLFRACVWAKNAAIANLRRTAVLTATMPWLIPAMDDCIEAMGSDFWPYGLMRNEATLSAFLRYAERETLLWRPLEPADLVLPLEQVGPT